ncbi:hypothetical protein PGT21_003201 [Puccinia graminis f. sp. tritici]|uniref:Uncharacterized protein n=1 Tax=Puccinia graminis f. sp. tritici TaxID=56615 RepID=A0A5B0LXR8_PUCGR|nr:hypothetical protein PGT21_003201 [Puccinia graminis f. sp. tritici]
MNLQQLRAPLGAKCLPPKRPRKDLKVVRHGRTAGQNRSHFSHTGDQHSNPARFTIIRNNCPDFFEKS